MTKTRKGYIDFLKTIGFLGLVAAHVKPPDWLMMLRSFDVPLLVILSGILAQKSSEGSYQQYLFKRIKRLLFPTWIFLTFYFLVMLAVGASCSPKTILKSYLLQQDSIGYVWIIWVYLLCAAATPILKRYAGKRETAILLITYVIYEVLCYYKVGFHNRFLYYTFYYFPYILLTYYGLNIERLSDKVKISIGLAAAFTFVILAVVYGVHYGSFQLVSVAKYPPTAYYLSYGVMAATFLILFFEKKHDSIYIYSNWFVRFVSSHSLWMYLWHILFVKAFNSRYLHVNWFVSFLGTMIGSLLITFLQDKTVRWIQKRKQSEWLKSFIG